MKRKRDKILIFIFMFGILFNLWFVAAEWNENLNDGLISYYNFDEGTGTFFEDSVVGTNNLTEVPGGNGFWVDGILGTGFQLDKRTNYVLNGTFNHTGIGPNGEFTITMWVNFRENIDQNIFSFSANGATTDGWAVSFIGASNMWSYLNGNNWNPSWTMSTNHWQFVVFRHFGDGTMGILINNTLNLTGDVTTPTLNIRVLSLGAGVGFGGISANVSYDEVGVWNRSLTDEEISQLYNNGVGITYSRDTNYPIFSTPIESPISPVIYSENQTYQFNISVDGTNGTAGIEFDGKNYSVSKLQNIFYWNISNLEAKSYSYYWWVYGNSSSNLFNRTATQNYAISKATGNISLFLDGISSNKTIDDQTNIELKANLSGGKGKIQIWVNGSLFEEGINSLRNTSIFSRTGLYNITAIYTGNGNFTSDSKTFWLNITEHIPTKSSSKKSSSEGGINEIHIDSQLDSGSSNEILQITGKITSNNLEENKITKANKKAGESFFEVFAKLLQEIATIISRLMAIFK